MIPTQTIRCALVPIPREPIPDATSSLTNEELRKLAETHRPPQAWYDEETGPYGRTPAQR